MTSKDFVKTDLLEWIKDFGGDAALYRNLGEGDIKFDFKKRDAEKLHERLWLKGWHEDFKQLPELVKTKVNEVSSSADMLVHEICYEANFCRSGQNKEGPDVAGKRNSLYKAIADLLAPHHYTSNRMTVNEMTESKSWIGNNVLNILLDPSDPTPAPPVISYQAKTSFIGKTTEQLVQGAGSMIYSLFGITMAEVATAAGDTTMSEVSGQEQKTLVVSTPSGSKLPGTSLMTTLPDRANLPPETGSSGVQATCDGSFPGTASSRQTGGQAKLKQE